MKNFTDMKQIRTWCGNIMNKKFLSRATDALSLRYPYTILILFALLGIEANGFIGSLVCAVIGALILLWFVSKIK